MTSAPSNPAEATHARLTALFATGLTQPVSHRLSQLRHVLHYLRTHQTAVETAVHNDLGRPPSETFVSSLTPIHSDLVHHLRVLPKLARPRVLSRRLLAPVKQHPVPKGVVLVIAPFNFPIICALRPVIAALAAGNVVVLKPSEFAPASEKLLRHLVDSLPYPTVQLVSGDASVSRRLMQLSWGHVVFTGSPQVGKAVMRAAADTLSPVTLELGGKNPVVVTRSAHLPSAAVAIVQGRFLNAGQVCLAADYCLVEQDISQQFEQELIKAVVHLFTTDPQNFKGYGRLHPRQLPRILSLLHDTSGVVIHGGDVDSSSNYVAPTLVRVTPDDILLQDEIFGPILPILAVPSVDKALSHISANPSPLCLYLFSTEKRTIDRVLQSTLSGSAAINETLFQVFPPGALLAGVGNSGLGGAYGGDEGFWTLSHRRVVLHSSPWISNLTHYFITPASMANLWIQRALRVFAGVGPGTLPQQDVPGLEPVAQPKSVSS